MWYKIAKSLIVAALAVISTKVSFDVMKKSDEKIEKENNKNG